jgi:hypothetical protein
MQRRKNREEKMASSHLQIYCESPGVSASTQHCPGAEGQSNATEIPETGPDTRNLVYTMHPSKSQRFVFGATGA